MTNVFKPIVAQPIDYLFNLMKTKAIENKLQFSAYATITKDKLPLKIVNDCISFQQKLTKEKESKSPGQEVIDSLYFFANTDTLLLLKNQLLANKELVVSFNERFIQMVHGTAQDMVNAYLAGDIAELEKRQYYYSGNRQYRDFINMLRTAVRIAPKEHYLYDLLAVQESYISGLVARLEMATAPNDSTLLATALRFQLKSK